jgi:hypothetical protein
MLYVATVHYKSPRWIEIQASYLRKHLSVPYQTWTSLEGIDPSYESSFDRVLQQRGPHAGKLNHLALEICHEADPDDLIMFLDGDAFPIADPMPMLTEGFERAPLVAVRRAENVNEPQPHPCFCVTTVRTWRSLPGDWSLGPVWPAVKGKRVSDVGANLLRSLELSDTPWVQLLRTNGAKFHPLFFAVYGDVVYHHGAGFRGSGLSRADLQRLKTEAAERSKQGSARRWLSNGIARVRGGGHLNPWKETSDRNNQQSEVIFEAIQRGDADWLARVTEHAAQDPGAPQPVTG